jgi:hypothetical protein
MENVGLGNENEDSKIATNPWMKVLQSAVDHDDEHVTKVSFLSLVVIPRFCRFH